LIGKFPGGETNHYPVNLPFIINLEFSIHDLSICIIGIFIYGIGLANCLLSKFDLLIMVIIGPELIPGN